MVSLFFFDRSKRTFSEITRPDMSLSYSEKRLALQCIKNLICHPPRARPRLLPELGLKHVGCKTELRICKIFSRTHDHDFKWLQQSTCSCH